MMLPLEPIVLILPPAMLPAAEILPEALTLTALIAAKLITLPPVTLPTADTLPVAATAPVTEIPVVLATNTFDTPPMLMLALPFDVGIPMLLVPLASLDDPAIPVPPTTNCPPSGLVSIKLSLVPDVIVLSPSLMVLPLNHRVFQR